MLQWNKVATKRYCNLLYDHATHCTTHHTTTVAHIDTHSLSKSTLQHAVARCNTLQHIATSHTTDTATYYTILQHAATHCSTLQHTATVAHMKLILLRKQCTTDCKPLWRQKKYSLWNADVHECCKRRQTISCAHPLKHKLTLKKTNNRRMMKPWISFLHCLFRKQCKTRRTFPVCM